MTGHARELEDVQKAGEHRSRGVAGVVEVEVFDGYPVSYFAKESVEGLTVYVRKDPFTGETYVMRAKRRDDADRARE